MIFIGTLIGFIHGIWKSLKDPEFRSLFWLVLLLLAIGTIFFMKVEHWNWLDALYFCFTTLATIGIAGSPVTPIGKIFTIIYIIIGISVLLGFINKIARNAILPAPQKKA